jgi:phosphoglycerate kinase
MKFEFQSLGSLKDFKGKKALVRISFNVPVVDGKVTDDFRVRRCMKTIEYLVAGGAKIILVSHMSGNEVNSLRPVFESLPKHLKAIFVDDFFTKKADDVLASLQNGEIAMFENLRVHSREKEADLRFAEDLASMGDFFVNEDFAVSHRNHASVVGIPKFLPSYAGFLFEEEISNLSKALNPEHPFLFILGGAKFATKIPLALKFADVADYVVVAGAISNEIFEEKGMEIGRSLSSPESLDVESPQVKKIILPLDVKIISFGKTRVSDPSLIHKDDRIVDIGPKTVEKIKELAQGAKLIIWNGPVGEYKEGYKETSLAIARIISESNAMTITGGGDTLAAISEIKVEEDFSFVSTAGGAMLEFLAKGTLPGIEALVEANASNSKS